MTTTTNYIAGHNIHFSDKPGLTVCGKRTETLATTTDWVTCQYCRDHMPTNREALLGLARAARVEAQPGSQHVPADDVHGQVLADIRSAWRGDND